MHGDSTPTYVGAATGEKMRRARSLCSCARQSVDAEGLRIVSARWEPKGLLFCLRGWLIDSSAPYMLWLPKLPERPEKQRVDGVLGKVDGLVTIEVVHEAVNDAGEPECPTLHRELCRQLLFETNSIGNFAENYFGRFCATLCEGIYHMLWSLERISHPRSRM